MEQPKITYEGEDVEYQINDRKISYSFKGVDSDAVEKLQPETHEKILSKIKDVDEEYKKIAVEHEELVKKEKIIKMNQEREEFYKEVAELQVFKDSGFTIKTNVIEPNTGYIGIKEITFVEDSGYNSVYFNDKITDNWNTYNSTKVWVLNFDYRKTRYVKLESAIAKYIEKIKKENVKIEQEKQADIAEKEKENILAEFCKKSGLTCHKRYQERKSGQGRFVYTGVKGNKNFNLSYDEQTREVTILSITISKPSSDFIKQMIMED